MRMGKTGLMALGAAQRFVLSNLRIRWCRLVSINLENLFHTGSNG